jgi:hypothetical protein
MSAYREEKWWNNTHNDAHTKSWLDAEWKVQEVNLEEGFVVFKKTEGVRTRSIRRRARTQALKPFMPVHVRIPKSRKPSKTKVSKLYARLKNLERNRASMPRLHGSFKPKPSHEKRLFKPEKKPQ